MSQSYFSERIPLDALERARTRCEVKSSVTRMERAVSRFLSSMRASSHAGHQSPQQTKVQGQQQQRKYLPKWEEGLAGEKHKGKGKSQKTTKTGQKVQCHRSGKSEVQSTHSCTQYCGQQTACVIRTCSRRCSKFALRQHDTGFWVVCSGASVKLWMPRPPCQEQTSPRVQCPAAAHISCHRKQITATVVFSSFLKKTSCRVQDAGLAMQPVAFECVIQSSEQC